MDEIRSEAIILHEKELLEKYRYESEVDESMRSQVAESTMLKKELVNSPLILFELSDIFSLFRNG